MTSSLMKQEIYIDNFDEYFLNSTPINEEKELNISNSIESIDIIKKQGVFEENIFSKNLFDIPINLNIVNNLGLEKRQKAKFFSILNITNNYSVQFSFKEFETDFNNNFKEFISLSKSANKLSFYLNKELKESLLKFKDIIKENIEKILLFIPNEDLTEIFDSTLTLQQISSIPYDFINKINNLTYSMNETNLIFRKY